jgi:hypothetical protein
VDLGRDALVTVLARLGRQAEGVGRDHGALAAAHAVGEDGHAAQGPVGLSAEIEGGALLAAVDEGEDAARVAPSVAIRMTTGLVA